MAELLASTFAGPGRDGDFAWMLGRPEHARTLFVFNDNEEQWRAHRRDPADRAGCAPGGGNAVVRPAQCEDPPRAIGIPTGRGGRGYARLTDDVRAVLDEALGAVAELLATGRYDRVAYSAAAGTAGDLGTGIFSVGEDVRRHVVDGLRRVTASEG
jgi:hypothetical protein